MDTWRPLSCEILRTVYFRPQIKKSALRFVYLALHTFSYAKPIMTSAKRSYLCANEYLLTQQVPY
jgi:hypothetical protein